ncbi:hypothetical protein ACIBO2_08890 [Nonomuraea sp. NPDC050022]|uniref:hypothetical protein n=1 Tax=Nonomuraea sp. NPDC050022 TaxID=3364358 RepID=UPI003787CA87
MKANKRVASVALMLGLFGSALVGGASMAQATGGYSCSNGLANVVTCNNTVVNVTAIKNSVFNTYASFNPTVIIKKINVCIASVCS